MAGQNLPAQMWLFRQGILYAKRIYVFINQILRFTIIFIVFCKILAQQSNVLIMLLYFFTLSILL